MEIRYTKDDHLVRLDIRDLDEKDVDSYKIIGDVISVKLKTGQTVEFNLKENTVESK